MRTQGGQLEAWVLQSPITEALTTHKELASATAHGNKVNGGRKGKQQVVKVVVESLRYNGQPNIRPIIIGHPCLPRKLTYTNELRAGG